MSYFGTTDHLFNISKGLVDGHSLRYVHSYGEVGTSQVLIWPLGGSITYKDTPSELWLTSTNINDTQDVRIVYIDILGDEQVKVVKLNGQTPVSIGMGLRVNRAFTYNSITKTLGDVYISNALTHTAGKPTLATTVMMYEAATQTRSMSLTTIPKGYTGYGINGYFSVPKGKDNDFYWNIRNPYSGIPSTNTNVVSIYQSTESIDFGYTELPERTDVSFTAKSESGSMGRVSIRAAMILVDNNFK